MAITFIGYKEYETNGEKRFGNCLKNNLDEDCLVWNNASIGKNDTYPDFIVFDPRSGLWIFEVKDWKRKTILESTRDHATILTTEGKKEVQNPLSQARDYAIAVHRLLEKDSLLRSDAGRLLFPWTYMVVFPNLTRKTFNELDLGSVMPPERVICKDEMAEDVSQKDFVARLKKQLCFVPKCPMTQLQIDHVRARIYPELRLEHSQGELDFEDDQDTTLIHIMDYQQEILARSLGLGHRIIHGVAGSGKTMILVFRAASLALLGGKPTLILCYNASLETYLRQLIAQKGLGKNVVVHHFHGWCREQVEKYGVKVLQQDGLEKYQAIENAFLEAVSKGKIPAEQYNAILIDEGHDFKPEWLRAVTYMLDIRYNCLLLLYDDAQSIYEHANRRNFSFKSVGIQAQGRTTVLRLNYRNTRQILTFAAEFAEDILCAQDADEDSVPLLHPESAGRQGDWPVLLKSETVEEEIEAIARCFQKAHASGYAWSSMLALYRATPTHKMIFEVFERLEIPFSDKNVFDLQEDKVKIVTLHSCKGLEAPVVAIPRVDQMPFRDCDKSDEQRLLYVGMTRATHHLLLTYSQEKGFAEQLLKVRDKICS